MIPDWVADYVGIPFVENGRTRAGLDCWGLVALVYREVFKVALPTYDGRYDLGPCDPDDRAALRARLVALVVEEAEAARWRRVVAPEPWAVGDALTMTVAGLAHVALYIAPGWMLHARRGTDSCRQRLVPPWTSQRVEAAYRHEALDG